MCSFTVEGIVHIACKCDISESSIPVVLFFFSASIPFLYFSSVKDDSLSFQCMWDDGEKMRSGL